MATITFNTNDLEAAALYLLAARRGITANELVREIVRPHLGPPCPECGCPRYASVDATYMGEDDQWHSAYQENKRLLRCDNQDCMMVGKVWIGERDGLGGEVLLESREHIASFQ